MNTKEIVKPLLVIAIILAVFIAGDSYFQKGSDGTEKPEASPSNSVAGPSVSNNPEASASPDVEKSPAVTASEPSGKVIYWMNIISNKKNYKFEHYCDGIVKLYKNDANHSGLVPADSTYYYCIGRNQLFLNLDGEKSVIKDEVISEAKDAPLLTDIKLLPSAATILISYSANTCITANDCGISLQENYVTIAFNIADNSFRDIKNYPEGEAIWNKSGMKAVFYPETCGGAGCIEKAIKGYDLVRDEATGVSNEKAAYDSGMCGGGKNCWADCGSPSSDGCLSVWDNLHWVDDSKVSATIISPTGEKNEITFVF